MAATGGTLIVLERAHRGSVETQFSDELLFVREMHRQSGGIDVLLRGAAVGYAVDAGFRPALRVAGRTVETVADPRGSLRQLLAEGAGVWIEERDLAVFGSGAAAYVMRGVRLATEDEPGPSWVSYERVWFF
jgi:hypothetical protein